MKLPDDTLDILRTVLFELNLEVHTPEDEKKRTEVATRLARLILDIENQSKGRKTPTLAEYRAHNDHLATKLKGEKPWTPKK